MGVAITSSPHFYFCSYVQMLRVVIVHMQSSQLKRETRVMTTLEGLNAVFTGDSANFHIFQVVGEDDYVGSLYVRKATNEPIPERVELTLITSSRDYELWKQGLNTLISKARDGSKAKKKLIKALRSYE